MFGLSPVGTLIVLVVVVLLVVVLAWPSSRLARVTDEAYVPHLSADAVDSALLRELADLPRWEHLRAHGRVHLMERTFVPGLAILIAIVAFPIGLLALLWKSRFRAEVSVVEAEGGCRVRFVCTAQRKDVAAFAAAIKRAAPSINVLV